MEQDLQGLRASINELAEQAVADGREEWLAVAAEVLRNGGEDLDWGRLSGGW